MEKPSIRRRFCDAINTAEREIYYYAGKFSTPDGLKLAKAENAGPLRSNFIDTTNAVTHRLHTHYHDILMEQTLRGDYVPKPNERDLLKAVYEFSTPYIERLTPYINQFTKSPAYLGTAIALCGVAIMANQNVRHNIAVDMNRASHSIAKNSDELINNVVTGLKPDIPPNLKIIPAYKPVRG